MSDPLFDADDASTPLTADEKKGLVPSHITLRRELNEMEQAGILEAEGWTFSRKRDVLDEKFLSRLHKEMFKTVWKWAGEYSKETGRNIGVDGYKIQTELRQMLSDVSYWIENKTYPSDEIAIRFHHRLVLIHPFPNGNGRHARLAADLLAVQLGRPRFTWGRESIGKVGSDIRKNYVSALRQADNHDITPLLHFARS
jgi:Fic-DOC domain mobile mystery protein B